MFPRGLNCSKWHLSWAWKIPSFLACWTCHYFAFIFTGSFCLIEILDTGFSFFFFHHFEYVVPISSGLLVSNNKSTIYYNYCSFICKVMFVCGCFQDCLLIFGFQQFEYDVPRSSTNLCVYLAWSFLRLLDLEVLNCHIWQF